MEPTYRHTQGELADLLVRVSWRLRKNERKELASFGLTFAQARALRLLVSAGRMRIGDLATALEIVPRSATTRVDDLEASGLVARSFDPEDRRSILVTPTPAGVQLIARLTSERQASADSLFALLSADDRSELGRLLESLTRQS